VTHRDHNDRGTIWASHADRASARDQLHPPEVITHRPSRGRRLLTAFLVLAVLAALGALGGLSALQARELRDQRRALASTRAALQKMGQQQADLVRQLSAQQATLGAVGAGLSAVEKQQRSDEQRLNLAQQSLPPDVSQLAQRVLPSVVLLRCQGQFIGSGFALDIKPSTGFGTVVATAAHVVSDCGGQSLAVVVGGADVSTHLRGAGNPDGPLESETDAALLEIAPRLPALHAASTLRVGQFVMAVGTPLLEQFAGNVTTGTVSKVAPTYFLHTAPISNGNSGGPLVDRDGHVLGIVSAGFAGSQSNPIAENLNIAERLDVLCRAAVLTGACPFPT
jgi:S1-C subfamily serine protease